MSVGRCYVSSYCKCTLQWTKQPTNKTAFCLVQHWCDHISDCCDSIEWLWSHNPDPLHSLCTWSPIDGDQLRSPSCSCWHLELQIQTRKHERRNVRAHCTICNVHLCLGTCSSLSRCPSHTGGPSPASWQTNQATKPWKPIHREFLSPTLLTNTRLSALSIGRNISTSTISFYIRTPRRRWTLNIECIISASTFQPAWFW